MPIYEYQCGACGQLQEFLQKVSEPPKTRCVHCGEEALTKQVTAAGFQLKGSGWYVTDFRNGGNKPAAKADGGSKPAESGKAAGAGSEGASASPAPAASPAPSASSGPATGS